MDHRLPTRFSKEIQPSYAKISALTKESPVLINLDGKRDITLLSYEYFTEKRHHVSELEAKLGVYAHLAQGIEDVKLGKATEMNEAFDDVLKGLENL